MPWREDSQPSAALLVAKAAADDPNRRSGRPSTAYEAIRARAQFGFSHAELPEPPTLA
jgi:hypothetical protein